MKGLLERYNSIQNEYRQESVIAKYSDIKEWSKDLNYALSEVLEKMTSEELNIVLQETTGFMRNVVQKYLVEAKKKEMESSHNGIGAVC